MVTINLSLLKPSSFLTFAAQLPLDYLATSASALLNLSHLSFYSGISFNVNVLPGSVWSSLPCTVSLISYLLPELWIPHLHWYPKHLYLNRSLPNEIVYLFHGCVQNLYSSLSLYLLPFHWYLTMKYQKNRGTEKFTQYPNSDNWVSHLKSALSFMPLPHCLVFALLPTKSYLFKPYLPIHLHPHIFGKDLKSWKLNLSAAKKKSQISHAWQKNMGKISLTKGNYECDVSLLKKKIFNLRIYISRIDLPKCKYLSII